MHNVKNICHLAEEFLLTAKKPLFVIVGPTASGKTSFSLECASMLARHGHTIEIVNADSRQLYKGLNIGTGKVTEDEMKGIPHHLFSVLDAKQPVTIAWYKKEAMRVIDDILHRGAVPLLVGGSMLYISAIIDGLTPPTAVDPLLRKRLEHEYDHDEGVSLFKRLQDVDPESAASIPRENKVYVIRALEILEMTGKKKSEQGNQSPCPYDLFIVGIDREREKLKIAIRERVKQMFEAGWIEEVQGLLDTGYSEEDPAMQSHGYRDIMQALRADLIDTNQLIEKISKHSIAYAKRQMTWWRGDERVRWVNSDETRA